VLADDGRELNSVITYRSLPHAGTDKKGYLSAGPDGLEYLREISSEIYADKGTRQQVSQKLVRYFEEPGICDGCWA
jgi:hypothetical protein